MLQLEEGEEGRERLSCRLAIVVFMASTFGREEEEEADVVALEVSRFSPFFSGGAIKPAALVSLSLSLLWKKLCVLICFLLAPCLLLLLVVLVVFVNPIHTKSGAYNTVYTARRARKRGHLLFWPMV